MPSESQRKFLTEASMTYQANLEDSPAEEYLLARGIDLAAAVTSRLGYVDPERVLPGHDMYRGMLAIPYHTAHGGVVAIKFRAIEDRQGSRYLWPAGQESHLYNVEACLTGETYIAICEGELDTCVAYSVCGVNSVGIAGVSHWKPHHSRVLRGFQEVFVITDNDDKETGNPGQDLAKKILNDIPGARNILLPRGQDINEFVLMNGREALPQLLGLASN